MDVLGEVVRGMLPTVGVSLLFAAAIWAILRADAAERAGRARVEAEEDAAHVAQVSGQASAQVSGQAAPVRPSVATDEDRVRE